MNLKFQHYFSVENKNRSILLYSVLATTCTSKKQGCHPLSSQHHDDKRMGAEKDGKPEIIMQNNVTKSGF